MKVLLDSVCDPPIVCPVYDEPGACPKCGQPMRPIRLFHADTRTAALSSSKDYRGGRWVTTTTYNTSYNNIQPCTLGFCDACHRAEQDSDQARKGQNPPSPVKWIAGVVLTVYGIAFTVRSIILNESEVNALLASAFAALALGLYLFFKNIGKYRKERKDHLRYKAGERDFTTVSESGIASMLTLKIPNEAYLTEEGLQELQKNSNPLYRFGIMK